ncbi:glutathione S-transferase-like [Plodia interpunctella]|uniref:glutathione S-transferase-like n=1 Tax=Plodia interpunctella TaxID=58824 RepID=UPI002367ECAD|nr:glutathione S-transferase-like [Plodia interpunctella]XP_053606046.1 glutathione S-transferase-like [Plodia interpunctella]
MAKKLYYFEFNGLAESIRYMLHYSGQKFEDIRYERKTWPITEIKDSLPYGQLPVYEEGDRKLNQSIAIARYIASQTGLLPSDPWEQAVLDAAVFNIKDFQTKARSYVSETDPVKREQLKTEFFTETLDYYLSRFEKELKTSNGYFGGTLSWADFYLMGILETINTYAGVEIEKNYPTIVALFKTIRSLSGVKEYIASRKSYVV